MSASEFDNTQALAEGWSLFNDNTIQRLDAGPFIQGRHTGNPSFASDEAAVDFVTALAREGSAYHSAALALCLPSVCPICHSKQVARSSEWDATSKEDSDNQGELSEYQCLGCGISFWL